MILFKFFILGILTALMFPTFFMFPLGFLIFPYLVIQILKIYKKNFIINYFICGLFFSLGFFCIFLFWIINPFLVYEDTKPFAILAIFLPILLSILFAFFFIIYKFFSNKYTIIIVTPFKNFSVTKFMRY